MGFWEILDGEHTTSALEVYRLGCVSVLNRWNGEGLYHLTPVLIFIGYPICQAFAHCNES